jgi:hypothetical protein
MEEKQMRDQRREASRPKPLANRHLGQAPGRSRKSEGANQAMSQGETRESKSKEICTREPTPAEAAAPVEPKRENLPGPPRSEDERGQLEMGETASDRDLWEAKRNPVRQQ